MDVTIAPRRRRRHPLLRHVISSCTRTQQRRHLFHHRHTILEDAHSRLPAESLTVHGVLRARSCSSVPQHDAADAHMVPVRTPSRRSPRGAAAFSRTPMDWTRRRAHEFFSQEWSTRRRSRHRTRAVAAGGQRLLSRHSWGRWSHVSVLSWGFVSRDRKRGRSSAKIGRISRSRPENVGRGRSSAGRRHPKKPQALLPDVSPGFALATAATFSQPRLEVPNLLTYPKLMLMLAYPTREAFVVHGCKWSAPRAFRCGVMRIARNG